MYMLYSVTFIYIMRLKSPSRIFGYHVLVISQIGEQTTGRHLHPVNLENDADPRGGLQNHTVL